jgi:hypothetical protein
MVEGQRKTRRKDRQPSTLKRLLEEKCLNSTAIYLKDPMLSRYAQIKNLQIK